MAGRLAFYCAGVMCCLFPNPAVAQRWSADLRPTEVDVHRYTSVVFLEDGKRVAAAGMYYNKLVDLAMSEIRCWNVASGEILQTLNGRVVDYGIGFGPFAVSPNGKMFAAAGEGRVGDFDDKSRSIEIWDIAKGEILSVLEVGKGTYVDLAFAPDGKTLATALDATKEVILWDVATWKPRRRLAADAGGGSSLAYSRDGKTRAVCGTKGLALINTTDERLYDRLEFDTKKNQILRLTLSPDGKAAALGGTVRGVDDGVLLLWRLESKKDDWKLSGKELIELLGYKDHGLIFSATFSPDGKLLAAGGHTKEVKVWDVASAKVLTSLTVRDGSPVSDVAFSPDGKHLATLDDDSLILWDVEEILRPDKR